MKRNWEIMDLKKIEKVCEGKYITRYDLTYNTENNHLKVYEMISRNHDIKTKDDLNNGKVDAVVLIIHSVNGERILLNREYRLAAGEWVYNFPAGLIDEGETPDESAKRELKEETGLELICIDDHIGESYSAVGFSNEKNVCIVGKAKGNITKSDSEYEEIKAAWYTKKEVKKLLSECIFAGRTQAYCYLWSRQG